MTAETLATLSALRKAMAAALSAGDRAEYHRLGAEHRRVLHAANPAMRDAWARSEARA